MGLWGGGVVGSRGGGLVAWRGWGGGVVGSWGRGAPRAHALHAAQALSGDGGCWVMGSWSRGIVGVVGLWGGGVVGSWGCGVVACVRRLRAGVEGGSLRAQGQG